VGETNAAEVEHLGQVRGGGDQREGRVDQVLPVVEVLPAGQAESHVVLQPGGNGGQEERPVGPRAGGVNIAPGPGTGDLHGEGVAGVAGGAAQGVALTAREQALQAAPRERGLTVAIGSKQWQNDMTRNCWENIWAPRCTVLQRGIADRNVATRLAEPGKVATSPLVAAPRFYGASANQYLQPL